MTRLNKYLAERLGISRREADTLIEKGKVFVNDEKGRLGQNVESKDKVTYNNQKLPESTAYQYIMLNKPVGYVSSRKKQDDSPTLYELLPKDLQNLKTVGRLDKNSSGLIILTNDGDFSFRMTHPKFSKTKVYIVELDRSLEPLHQQFISDFGINLPDGNSKLGLRRLNNSRKEWEVTMQEGRNRQIRRTFGALGYTVTKLHRISFGKYRLGSLKPGDFIYEIKKQ